ncbi:MAG: hypothetical protein JXN64_01320 [Spirochaetes bacterium]|nr:hypothetical protein [Spirochaetota bacterium]
MALRKLNTFSLVGNDDIDALMETINKSYKTANMLSLTEMSTNIIPKIAAGSVIEVNGSLYIADSDESISGSPSDGIIYIKMIPAGDPISVTAEFTNIVPVWDAEKQGWYSPVSGEENYRVIGGCYKASSSYTAKFIYWGYYTLPKNLEHKLSTHDITTTVAQNVTIGTYDFICTFNNIIEAIINCTPMISVVSAVYVSVASLDIGIDSISIVSNQVTIKVRYKIMLTQSASGFYSVVRLSLFTAISGY